jgi:hypothetical protein
MTTEMNKREMIKDALRTSILVVEFVKADGETRQMRCTLRSDLVPVTPIVEGKNPKKENPDVQAVWDLGKNAWRSFRFDSINEVVVEESAAA